MISTEVKMLIAFSDFDLILHQRFHTVPMPMTSQNALIALWMEHITTLLKYIACSRGPVSGICLPDLNHTASLNIMVYHVSFPCFIRFGCVSIAPHWLSHPIWQIVDWLKECIKTSQNPLTLRFSLYPFASQWNRDSVYVWYYALKISGNMLNAYINWRWNVPLALYSRFQYFVRILCYFISCSCTWIYHTISFYHDKFYNVHLKLKMRSKLCKNNNLLHCSKSLATTPMAAANRADMCVRKVEHD